MNDWKEIYQSKLLSVEEAAQKIESGDQIYVHSTACIPTKLMEALAARKDELKDVTIHGGQCMYPYTLLKSDEYRGKLNYITNFYGGFEHKYFKNGNIDINSVHLSRLSQALTDVYHCNVLMVEVTAPDEEGYLYFGVVGTAASWDVAQKADKIILQVNRLQPRPNGFKHRIHVSEVTWLCESESPMPEFPQPEPSEADLKIAEHILPMIPDGATLQIGLGGLANAIGYGLGDRKNLSVHTEMYTDSMLYLAKKGVITGKQLAAFGLGSKELYEYVGSGPVQLAPISIVNDPYEIAKNDNMISINACLMADLTGQICSESIGFRQYSCTGGQLDYVRGAAMSKGGKSFLCLNSTHKDKDGNLKSKINLELPRGAVVTTPRSDVMYVVTEYGIADLWLRTIEERVHAMISIAHPAFREQLRQDAIREGLIRD